MPMGELWTQHRDDELYRLWCEGYTDDEIGQQIGRTAGAVASRRNILNLTGQQARKSMRLSPVTFPMFTDIMKAECRVITATTPPSGKFSRSANSSGMTSCAVMVMEA